jgi:origin recognition complex subunit 2
MKSIDQSTRRICGDSEVSSRLYTGHIRASSQPQQQIACLSNDCIQPFGMKRKQREDDELTATSATPTKKRIVEENEQDAGSPTPKANGTLETPTKPSNKRKNASESAKKADRSAKRKSASTLLESEDDDEFGTALAQEILEDDDEGLEEGIEGLEGLRDDLAELAASALQETPSKRGRGRPKGSKNKRSPTPEGDLPPEERYFFQNRSGPPEVSNNTLASLKLLTHDEYFALIRNYKDPHDPEKAYLMRLHARSFPQWRFEWHEGFSICLYGWGSKRQLVNKFADWLYPKFTPPPKIVIVNGYTPKLNIRTILSTVIEAAMGPDIPGRLRAQPAEMLDLLLTHLDNRPPKTPIMILINSIDSPSLRRQSIQSLLARLASHPSIYLLATADTPTFPLLWDTNLRDQFSFVFHDCTTYAPYTAELNVVDDVHELLGRKGRRIGGGEGIGFVLRSLTENSRKLYVLLLTEVLSVLAEGMPDAEDELDGEMEDVPAKKPAAHGQEMDGEVGVEYKALYQKASESFICSSEMNFRTLLKEFYDHQMIVSRKDGVGTEMLGVPLGREEMETLLEELVMAGN